MVNIISKKFLLKLSVLSLAFIFTVILIEKVILKKQSNPEQNWRLKGLFQLDSELIYSHKKNFSRSWKFNDGNRKYIEVATTNNLGLRDNIFKPKDQFDKRILILGDSMTYGHGVKNDESFPNQLELIYSENSTNVDVLNAGVKGYGTDQFYKFFKKRLLIVNTDLLVFVVYKNDLLDNITQPLYTINNGRLIELDATKSWLYITGKLQSSTPIILRKTNIYKFFLSSIKNRDLFFLLPDYDYRGLLEWSKQKVYLQIKDLKNLGTENNFEVIVLTMPFKNGSADEYEWLYRLPELGVNYIDFSKNRIWRQRRRELFFRNDYHLSTKGNRVLAEMFYEYLKDFEQGSMN